VTKAVCLNFLLEFEKKIRGMHKEERVEAKEEKSEHEMEKTAQGKGFSQAGGHEGAFSKDVEGKIRKRVGKNEFQFYRDTLPHYPELQPFLPTCYGTEEREGNKYVVLEDLTQYYKKPCILDVKIGVTSVGEDASPEKRESMAAKDKKTTTHSEGLRVTAMKVFQEETAGWVALDKPWGQALKAEDLTAALSRFFDSGVRVHRNIAQSCLALLRPLLLWFQSQAHLRFYSSSLLFLYDGERLPDTPPRVDVKMIDFAHVHPIKEQDGRDDGYLFGLNNLIKHLEKISQEPAV